MSASGYCVPDAVTLRGELARAGADENMQIAGVLWIASAVRGIERPKANADEVAKLRKLKSLLEAAYALAASPSWLAEDVHKPVGRAIAAVNWALQMNPGGHRQNAHASLAQHLHRFFTAEQLPVAVTPDSPFVRIFAACTGMEPEVAKSTLARLWAKQKPSV